MAFWAKDPRDEFIFPLNSDIGATMVPQDDGLQHFMRSLGMTDVIHGNSIQTMRIFVWKFSRIVAKEIKDTDYGGTRRLGSTTMVRAVEGHFDHPHDRNWKDITDHVNPVLATLAGTNTDEIACMGTLTANLHLMMNAFYKPTPERYKILCEARAFPSDQYAFASQAQSHGFEAQTAIIEISPRKGEFNLRESDILDMIEKEGDSIALIIFSGVQYYTGQWFPMKAITAAGQRKARLFHGMGAMVGWDLAHAIGNVPLSLHDWNVDFAVWCSYKYLNSGPGGIGGLFVHEKWHASLAPKHAGWWGHDPKTRFDMPKLFSPIRGAQGFQQSNPSVLATVSLLGSLQIFQAVGGVRTLRARSVALTGLLEGLLRQTVYYVPPTAAGDTTRFGFTIITPEEQDSRGAQLSLLFLPAGSGLMQKVFAYLKGNGVIGDERNPDVIRLAPAPLYNTEEECIRAAEVLNRGLQEANVTV